MEITQVCACEKPVQGKKWINAVTLHRLCFILRTDRENFHKDRPLLLKTKSLDVHFSQGLHLTWKPQGDTVHWGFAFCCLHQQFKSALINSHM